MVAIPMGNQAFVEHVRHHGHVDVHLELSVVGQREVPAFSVSVELDPNTRAVLYSRSYPEARVFRTHAALRRLLMQMGVEAAHVPLTPGSVRCWVGKTRAAPRPNASNLIAFPAVSGVQPVSMEQSSARRANTQL